MPAAGLTALCADRVDAERDERIGLRDRRGGADRDDAGRTDRGDLRARVGAPNVKLITAGRVRDRGGELRGEVRLRR